MIPPRDPKRLPAALALGLALGLPAAALAQSPGVSSGSGAGTGTGSSAGSGFNSTGTGNSAGAGIGSTGTGSESASGTGRNTLPSFGGDGRMRGADVPLSALPTATNRPLRGLEVGQEQVTVIDSKLLDTARSVADPADRALVLQRIADTKITFGQRLTDAHVALAEAAQAAVLLPPSTLKDRRLMSIVETLLKLGDSQVRAGLQPDAGDVDPAESGVAPPREKDAILGTAWLDRAAGEWGRADRVATAIGNPNFRGQMLSRVAEARAVGASQMAGEAAGAEPTEPRSERPRRDNPLVARADGVLAAAVAEADRIDRPVWHDNALQSIATKASNAGRFPRALDAARAVGRPEIRVDAFVRVAEQQVRRDLQDDATATYSEAARAVASIPSDDPRMILAGILIDSLISSGRFEDARASVDFIARPHRRIAALGAVAESQGRRGLSDVAMAWIDRDAPPEFRPLLRRRVTDGMLATVEQYRTNAQNVERAR